MPFIPLETELDQLIAACCPRIATVLQTAKETGARIGEISHLQWIDFDPTRKTLNITPEKHSLPRVKIVSDKLLGMINALPKKDEYLFNPKTAILRTVFDRERKAVATKLNNPRLLKITFHTIRHWKGTMEYHKTKDPYHVKKCLGHKTLKSTEIYINIDQAIFQIENDEYTCKIAHNEQEVTQLIETGFEYVTDIGENKAFRKRK
jgi:integrase